MSAESSPSSAPTASEIPPVPAGHSQLYLKNLSFSTTEDSLSAHVQSITGAKPHSVNIVTTKRPGKFQGRSRGFGFVTVVESAAANLINKLNNVEFEGRVISVVEAKPRDPNAPRPERKPRQPRQPRNNNNNNNTDNNNNNTSDSKSESSSSSSSEPRPKPERKTFENASQLYVNNLSFETTQEELAALFQSKTGVAPLDVEIVKSRFGKYKNRSRGFGFVFVSNSVLDKALALDSTTVNERAIGVQHAKPPQDNQDRPPRTRKPRRQSNNENGDNNNNNDAVDTRRRRAPKSDNNNNNNNGDNNNNNDGSSAPRRGRGGRRGRGRGRGGRGGNTNNNAEQQQQ